MMETDFHRTIIQFMSSLTPGTYTVNLTATNENGTNSKLATINVTEK